MGIVHIPAPADLKAQLWKVSRYTWRKGDGEAPSPGWQSPPGEGHVGHTLLPSPVVAFRGEEKVLQSRGWRSRASPRSVLSQPEQPGSITCTFVLTRRVPACVQRRGFGSVGAATLRTPLSSSVRHFRILNARCCIIYREEEITSSGKSLMGMEATKAGCSLC